MELYDTKKNSKDFSVLAVMTDVEEEGSYDVGGSLTSVTWNEDLLDVSDTSRAVHDWNVDTVVSDQYCQLFVTN